MEITVIANKKGSEIVRGWMEKHLPQARITYKKGRSGAVKIICSGQCVFTELEKILQKNRIALAIWVEGGNNE